MDLERWVAGVDPETPPGFRSDPGRWADAAEAAKAARSMTEPRCGCGTRERRSSNGNPPVRPSRHCPGPRSCTSWTGR